MSAVTAVNALSVTLFILFWAFMGAVGTTIVREHYPEHWTTKERQTKIFFSGFFWPITIAFALGSRLAKRLMRWHESLMPSEAAIVEKALERERSAVHMAEVWKSDSAAEIKALEAAARKRGTSARKTDDDDS